MEFEDEITIDTTKEELWKLVSDPEVLVKCVPGAKEVNKQSETTYTGVIERGLAGVSIALDGEVEMTELDEPDHLEATASGQDSRTNSRMDADAEMDIADNGDETATLHYYIDMDFTGRLATLGSRIVKRKIKSDIGTFFDNIRDYSEENKVETET